MKRAADTLSAGAQKKRQKIRDARNIASESSSASLRNGALPIQEFIAARKFEIKALTDAVQNSREAGVQRAFQSLPRHLRRRAASHNVKRVPKRLRARAMAELKEDDKQAKCKRVPYGRKRGRKTTIQKLAKLQVTLKNQATTTEEPRLLANTELPSARDVHHGRFAKRQRDKTWLPTHLWASKRNKMATKWGYALPIHSNQKSYRPTHRASTSKGAMIFDTSYDCHVLLKGKYEELSQLIERLTRTRETCGLRAFKGERTASGNIYSDERYLCPVTLLWNGCGTKEATSLILSVHPAAFVEVWKLILNGRKHMKLETLKVIDMRFHIGSMKIVGPLAINALQSVLKVEDGSDCGKAFKSFHDRQVGALISNVILSFSARDFRTVHPPRMTTGAIKQENEYLKRCPIYTESSKLFSREDVEARNATRPKGAHNPERSYPSVPVIVYANDLGLNVLAPWEYIADLSYSLNHLPNVLFGGLQELAQIHFEHVKPFFPNDFPGTTAGDALALELRKEREQWHRRRPPAKRISYSKVINGKPEIGDPFTCDFAHLLDDNTDLSLSDLSHVSVSVLDKSSTLDTTIDVTMEDIPVSAPLYTSTPQIPLVVAESIPRETLSQVHSSIPPIPVAATTDVSVATPAAAQGTKRGEAVLLHASQLDTCAQLATGIIQVRIRMRRRGSPKSCARIYHAVKGKPADVIGFVTTGNFSLAEGQCTAIGCLLATQVKQTVDKRKHDCFVRNSGLSHFEPAEWTVII